MFVISFEKDKMTLRVPTHRATAVGMRSLSTPDVVSKALETLRGRARVKRAMWSRRAQEYEQKINSGDLLSIAEVVRDLHRADDQREQSYSERQLYEAALERLTREVAAVSGIDEVHAAARSAACWCRARPDSSEDAAGPRAGRCGAAPPGVRRRRLGGRHGAGAAGDRLPPRAGADMPPTLPATQPVLPMELHFESVFYEIAALVLLAGAAGFVGLLLRQPLIVSFIAVGVLAGPDALGLATSTQLIDLLGEISIAVLLFLSG